MENLLAYILLLVPGLIIILINERIGLHPSAKYTNIEKTVMAVLFSIPVLIFNLLFMAFINSNWNAATINFLLDEIKTVKGLLIYSASSSLWLYIVCCFWHDYLKKNFVVSFINQVRNTEGKSSLGDGLVWEDAFHGREPQAVMVLLKDEKLYGSPVNGSENISDERCLYLSDSKIVQDIVTKYNVPVDKVYVDTKSGVAVKIYDRDKFKEAYVLHKKYCDID